MTATSLATNWFGELPSSWTFGNIRRFAKMKTGHTPSRNVSEYWDNTTIPWFTLADVWQLRDGRQVYLGETNARISEAGLANSAAELLPAGTVVFSRTASVGFSGIMPIPMATSQDFWNWVCGESLLPKYLFYIFRSMQPHLRGLMMGSTHKTIYQTDAASLSIPVPPIDVQHRIVRFLDCETEQIDALIGKQNVLIDLLGERRQAVITRAVTKGLDPYAPATASGTAWVGDIPVSWAVSTLKHFCDVLDCKHLTAEFISDGIPLASIREVKGRYIDLTAAKRTTEEFYLQLIEGGRLPRPGDLIFSRNATVGEVAIVPPTIERFAMGQDVCLLRPVTHRSNSEFVRYLLKSATVVRQIELAMIGSTFYRINVEAIRNLIVPLPPIEQQRSIVNQLDDDMAKLDGLIDKAGRSVQLLHERRSALVTAAVTGKIDVRGRA